MRDEIARLGGERRAAVQAVRVATRRLRDVVVRAVTDGDLSESAAAREGGVTRRTVRKWLGKR